MNHLLVVLACALLLGTGAPRVFAESIDDLIEDLRDADPETQAEAARAVGNKRLDREQHRKLLAALADALTSKNARTRKYVAYAICEYISGADTLPPSLVPRLVCRLKDSNEQVRDICSTALKRLASPREDILVKLLTDKSDAVRIEAVQAFGVLAAMNKPPPPGYPATSPNALRG